MAIILILIFIMFMIEAYGVYVMASDNDNIPLSLYYKKIARLQKEIENLEKKLSRLNPNTQTLQYSKVIETISKKNDEILYTYKHIELELEKSIQNDIKENENV